MSSESVPPKVTSSIRDIRAPSNFQAIEATYYSLTDSDARSLAGLLVLLDSLHRPVRAEVHLYSDVSPTVRDQMLRQAQQILQGRYYARQPVPLRVLDVQEEQLAVDVPLPETPPPGMAARPPAKSSRRPLWLALAGLLLALALAWLGWRFFTGGEAEPVDAAAPATAPVDAPAADAPAPTAIASDPGLPPSVNADPGVAVGSTVRIKPGYQAFLLDAPDAETGAQRGVIGDGQTMTVRDGPVLRQGLTDTIVWWYVLTDTGLEGWAPANTSELTLLEPVAQ